MPIFFRCVAISTLPILVGLSGCKGSDFASQTPQNGKSPCVDTDTKKCNEDDDLTNDPNDPNSQNDPNNPGGKKDPKDPSINPVFGNDSKDGFDVGDGGLIALTPQICDQTNIKIIRTTGECGPHMAAYAADDRAGSPTDLTNNSIACCPLPSKNMLKAGTRLGSKGACEAGDVIVGLSNGNAVCATINTAAFKLGPKQSTCVQGSGVSGGGGAQKCEAPQATASAMIGSFGSDSCLPSPFGGLITNVSSKYCASVNFRMVTKLDGSEVKMYK